MCNPPQKPVPALKGAVVSALAACLSKRITWLLLFGVLMGLSSCALFDQDKLPPPRPLFPDDPRGTNLPVGVPRMVDTNGNVIAIDHQFTTPQYRQAAIQLLLQEANRAAGEMGLSNETVPITEANVKGMVVPPFGFSYIHKSVGVVETSNYVYVVGRERRLCEVDVDNYDEVCLKLDKTTVPLEQMDTNAAYNLATQWLASASMDVQGLNQDCQGHVAISAYWSGLARLGDVPQKNFSPIYYVWWTSPKNDAEGYGNAAYVELFLPTKTLIQMSIHDPKYILRKPLVFTNLDSLFPGTGKVVVLPNLRGPVLSPGRDKH